MTSQPVSGPGPAAHAPPLFIKHHFGPVLRQAGVDADPQDYYLFQCTHAWSARGLCNCPPGTTALQKQQKNLFILADDEAAAVWRLWRARHTLAGARRLTVQRHFPLSHCDELLERRGGHSEQKNVAAP